LPNPHKAFLKLWVRREAVCKANGQGVSGVWPGRPPGENLAWQETDADQCWSVRELTLGEDLLGAVATDRMGMVVKYFKWTEQKALSQGGYLS